MPDKLAPQKYGVFLQANITSNALLGGWVTASPTSGTIAAGQDQVITVKYDVSQNEFQGVYTAEILLTTDAQPLAKVVQLFFRWFAFHKGGITSAKPESSDTFSRYHFQHFLEGMYARDCSVLGQKFDGQLKQVW